MCGVEEFAVPTVADLLEVLMILVGGILQIEEDAVFPYIAHRTFKTADQTHAIDELMEVDEASKLLSRDDEEKLQKVQKKMGADNEVYVEFMESWTRKRRSIREKKTAAKAKAKAAPKAAARRPLPPADALTIIVANGFKPPNSSLWRSNTVQAWNGRYLTHPIVSRSWRKYGSSNAALRAVLVEMWVQHCRYEGITADECPIIGIF